MVILNKEVIYQFLSSISCASSGAVVYTIPHLRKNPLMNIIFVISICDFIGSIVNLFGFPLSATLLCQIQGFLFVFFFPASWYIYFY